MITQAHAQRVQGAGRGLHQRAEERADPLAGELRRSAALAVRRVNLAEISSPLFPGERLVVCRNPAVAAERARKRAELLAATESELEKVKASVEGPRGRLRGAPAGQIGERAGKIANKYKVAKHFTLTDRRRRLRLRAQDRADQQRGLPGRPLRDPHHPPRPDARRGGRGPRLQAAENGRARVRNDEGHDRDPPDPPPPRDPRPRARVPLHARLLRLLRAPARLPELLFTDQTPLAPADPVKPATRSPSAHAKAGSATTPTGYPAHTLTDLLADLATICRNTVRIGHAEHTFTRLTTPTPLQAHTLELLDIKHHQ